MSEFEVHEVTHPLQYEEDSIMQDYTESQMNTSENILNEEEEPNITKKAGEWRVKYYNLMMTPRHHWADMGTGYISTKLYGLNESYETEKRLKEQEEINKKKNEMEVEQELNITIDHEMKERLQHENNMMEQFKIIDHQMEDIKEGDPMKEDMKEENQQGEAQTTTEGHNTENTMEQNLVEEMEGMRKKIILISEEDASTVMELELSMDDEYELQNDSLIVWHDPKDKMEKALSFQQTKGCIEIWNTIRRYQGREEDAQQKIEENRMKERLEKIDLPEVTKENLNEVLSIFVNHEKQVIANSMMDSQYIFKLFDCFDELEKENDMKSLHIMFNIFKNLILLNTQEIYNFLLSDHFILKLMGALEYDPDLPEPVQHRQFLQNEVSFQQVIPFSNEAIVKKIHKSYRVNYLKESVLPRCLDDAAYSTLNVIVHIKNFSIIELILSDKVFLEQLFIELCDPQTPETKLLALMKFLNEFNNMLSNIEPANKERILQELITNYGLFKALTRMLEKQRHRIIKQITSKLIYSIINFKVAFFHQYIIKEICPEAALNASPENYVLMSMSTNRSLFLENWIYRIIDETEFGVQQNLSESLKVLLSPDDQESQIERAIWLLFFSHNYGALLVSPLKTPPQNVPLEQSREQLKQVLSCLCYLVSVHEISWEFVLANDLLSFTVDLIRQRSRERDLTLSAIRFVRACASQENLAFPKYMMEHHILDPIVTILSDYGESKNMMSSAVIVLLENCATNNEFQKYIANRYYSILNPWKDSIPVVHDIINSITTPPSPKKTEVPSSPAYFAHVLPISGKRSREGSDKLLDERPHKILKSTD